MEKLNVIYIYLKTTILYLYMIYDTCSYREVKQRTIASPYYFATDHLHDGKTIKKYIQCIQTPQAVQVALQEDHHLYEILTNLNRKLYIDIDHIRWTEAELDQSLNELLHTLSTLLRVNILKSSVIVLCNEPTEDHYTSIHFIFTTLCMDYPDQKILMEYINATSAFELDTRVYTSFRLFRCMNQSKLDKTPLLLKTNHSIMDTLINVTDHLPHYTFQQVYQPPKIKPKTLVKTPTELIHWFLLKKDPILFQLNKKHCWSSVTKLIYQFPSLFDMDDWLKKSAELSQYTYEENQSYVETLDEYEYDDDNYLFVIANTILDGDTHFLRATSTNPHLENYLLRYFPSTLLPSILEILQYEDMEATFTHQSQEYEIDRHTGFITSDHFKINYHYDVIETEEYPNIVTLNDIQEAQQRLEGFLENEHKLFVLKSAWGTGKTQYCLKRVVELCLNQRILLITSVNSLNLTMTKQLNEFITSLYDGNPPADQLFYSHLDTQQDKTIHLKKCKHVVCSIQSLVKVENTAFDVVFIDEFESVLNGYYGYQTFKIQSIQSLFHMMCNILNLSSKVFLLDADISKQKVELLQTILGQPNTEIYKNQQRSFITVSYEIHNQSLHEYMLLILEEQLNGTKMVIPCASRNKALDVLMMLGNTMSENAELRKSKKEYSDLVEKYYEDIKHRVILYIDRDGIKLYKTNGAFHDYTVYKNDEVYINLDAFITLHHIDTFIYTPTITTGISINHPHFDKSYAISSHLSINYKEFIQMIHRTRVLGMNQSNVHIEAKLFKSKHYQTSMEQVLKSQVTRIKLINELATPSERNTDQVVHTELLVEIEQMNHNDIQTLTTQTYCMCQMINMLNLKHTRDNFTFNFIQVLKYHVLNYSYSTRKSKLGEYCVSSIDNLQSQNAIDFDKWERIPILTYSDYMAEHLRQCFTDTTKRPILHDVYHFYLELYFEEPREELKQSYWKTHWLFYLLKVNDFKYRCITDIEAYKLAVTATNLHKTHLLLTNGQTCIVDTSFYECLQHYSLCNLWGKYIKNQDYYRVVKLRQFIKQPTLTTELKSYTEKDVIKIKSNILKIICHLFHIDFTEPKELIVTNKTFKQNITLLCERCPTIYNFITNQDIPKESTDYSLVKAVYGYIKKECLEELDYGIGYVSAKNTTRDTDKLRIYPAGLWIDYGVKTKKEHTTIHKKNPHLLLLQPKEVSLEKVEILDKAKTLILLTDIQRYKKLTYKDTLALYKTLLLEGSLMERYKKLNYKEALALYKTLLHSDLTEKLIYKSYYHHPVIKMNTTETTCDVTYSSSRQYNKTVTIPVTHSTVSSYTLQDTTYVKMEDKVISRPYDYTQKAMKTRPRPNGSFIEDFVSDIINDVISRIELKEELKTTFKPRLVLQL